MTYDNITILKEIEHVRLRPSLWVGDTNDATQLFSEVFDNAIDEALVGVCNRIDVNYNEQSFSIQDSGRGIPQGFDEENQQYEPILICTRLFSGGKFNGDAYDTSIGTHGVGLSCVNFLSDKLHLSTWRDHKQFSVNFIDGVPEGHKICKNREEHGTVIAVHPSKRFFTSTSINESYLTERVRIAKMFIPTLEIYVNGNKIKRTNPASEVDGDLKTIEVVAFVTNQAGKLESIKLYLNYSLTKTDARTNHGVINLREVNSGAHIRTLERAIIASWRSALSVSDNDFLQDKDLLLGCRSYISLRLVNPKYSSQTKETLAGNIWEYGYIQDAIVTKLSEIIKNNINKKEYQSLLHRFKDYRSNLNTLSSAKYLDEVLEYGEKDEKTGINRGISLESKLIDCISRSRTGTELFVCEGDSAKLGIKKTRNPQKHAILPLRGKLRNIADEDLSKVLQNIEIRSLVNAIGIGVKHKQDISRIRYDRIIIATDADTDGGHIQILIIGALAYLVPDVIRNGYVYIAQAPLFGKYEKNKFIPIYEEPDLINGKYKRYKGLGSLNESEIGITLISPETRRLHKITAPTEKSIENAKKLIGNSAFRKLMLIENGAVEQND